MKITRQNTRRIEPTIGSTDNLPNKMTAAKISREAKSRRTRGAIEQWAGTTLLLIGTLAIGYLAASYAGVMPQQFRLGAPQLLERLLILCGLAVLVGSQVVGSIWLFRFSFERGALALLLPGYLMVGLKRSGIFWPVMGPWCAGVLLVVIGTLLLS